MYQKNLKKIKDLTRRGYGSYMKRQSPHLEDTLKAGEAQGNRSHGYFRLVTKIYYGVMTKKSLKNNLFGESPESGIRKATE